MPRHHADQEHDLVCDHSGAHDAALARLIGTPGLSWSERQVSIASITIETVLVATGCSPQRLRRSFATPLEGFEQVNRWMFVCVAYDPVAMFLVDAAIAMERRRKGGRRESEIRGPRRDDRRPVDRRRSPQAQPQRPRGRAPPRRFRRFQERSALGRGAAGRHREAGGEIPALVHAGADGRLELRVHQAQLYLHGHGHVAPTPRCAPKGDTRPPRCSPGTPSGPIKQVAEGARKRRAGQQTAERIWNEQQHGIRNGRRPSH